MHYSPANGCAADAFLGVVSTFIAKLHIPATRIFDLRACTLARKIESRLTKVSASGNVRAKETSPRLCAAADDALQKFFPAVHAHAVYPGCCLATRFFARAAFIQSWNESLHSPTERSSLQQRSLSELPPAHVDAFKRQYIYSSMGRVLIDRLRARGTRKFRVGSIRSRVRNFSITQVVIAASKTALRK